MAHVFDGAPDARQADDIVPSRFRPQYRALTDAEKALHDEIKTKAAELERLFERARDLRYPIEIFIGADVPAEDLAAFTLSADTGSTKLEPGELKHGFTAFLGPDYFGEGMKSLELSVMWTVKGLTA